MATVAATPITAEEFARMPEPADGSKQELVRGEVVTMPPPGFDHGVCQVRISGMLDFFVRSGRLGRITTESGLRTEQNLDSVRGPDVAYWSADRLPLDQRPSGYPDVAADLCVEIRSPHDTRRRISEKVREYLARGVRMVWVVDPDDRTVTVYRQPGEGRVLWETATLTGEDVLPGFTCRVGEFFE
jgi:Uma2 family endonuclease